MSSRARQIALVGAALLAAVCWLAWSTRERTTTQSASDSVYPSPVESRASAVAPSNELLEIAEAPSTRADVATQLRSRASDISVLGRVVDELGRPIERFGIRAIHRDANNWFVETRDWPVEQHDAGEFDLTGLPAGRWEIAPYQEGLALKQPQILTHAVDLRLDFVMQGIAAVEGFVLEPDGDPVADSEITVEEWRSSQPREEPFDGSGDGDVRRHAEFHFTQVVRTNIDGAFRVEFANGVVRLQAKSPGWLQSEPVKVKVEAREVARGIELGLRKAATLSGLVVDELGRPLAGSARVAQSHGAGARVALEEGRFEFSGLEPGRTVLRVQRASSDSKRDERLTIIEMNEGDEKELTLTFERRRSVRVIGRIASTSKILVRGHLQPKPVQGQLMRSELTKFDVIGSSSFDVDLEPGKYHISFAAPIASGVGAFAFGRDIEIPDQDLFELVIDE